MPEHTQRGEDIPSLRHQKSLQARQNVRSFDDTRHGVLLKLEKFFDVILSSVLGFIRTQVRTNL